MKKNEKQNLKEEIIIILNNNKTVLYDTDYSYTDISGIDESQFEDIANEIIEVIDYTLKQKKNKNEDD